MHGHTNNPLSMHTSKSHRGGLNEKQMEEILRQEEELLNK
jgi:hypothetical protein